MTTSKHLERRRVEAEMLLRIYQEMADKIGEKQTLDILTNVIEKAAFEEGDTFSRTAKVKPNLDHFRTIIDYWGDALSIEDVQTSQNGYAFKVTKCAYIDFYKNLGLPPQLVKLLSCKRDAPFAKGYSKRLTFKRQQTIADGADHCDFGYQWQREV